MPDIGERRTSRGETREWNGYGWVRIATPSAASRALGAFAETTPLNPLNIPGQLAAIPGQLAELERDPITGLPVRGEERQRAIDALGRLLKGEGGAGLEALYHTIGAVPLAGPIVQGVAGRFAEGDIAGGLGAAAGAGSAGYVPGAARALRRAPGRVPGALQRTGGTLEESGGAIAKTILERGPLKLAVAAAPYAVQVGGRALGRLGRSLEGLQEAKTPAKPAPRMRRSAEAGPYETERLYTEARRAGMSEQAARQAAGIKTQPMRPRPPIAPIPSHEPSAVNPTQRLARQLMAEEAGRERTTGSFEPRNLMTGELTGLESLSPEMMLETIERPSIAQVRPSAIEALELEGTLGSRLGEIPFAQTRARFSDRLRSLEPESPDIPEAALTEEGFQPSLRREIYGPGSLNQRYRQMLEGLRTPYIR